jgi:hypothetical protein
MRGIGDFATTKGNLSMTGCCSIQAIENDVHEVQAVAIAGPNMKL